MNKKSLLAIALSVAASGHPAFAENALRGLSVGVVEACAITGDDRPTCFGIGTGTQRTPAIKGKVSRLHASTWSRDALCAISDDAIQCEGTFGSGETLAPGKMPKGKALDVQVGASHACALFQGGDVWCWGNRLDGRSGDGEVINQTSAFTKDLVKVELFAPATQITVGRDHSCAVLQIDDATASPYCWGMAESGEGPAYAARGNSRYPRYIYPLGDQIVSISAGMRATCAVDKVGGTRCVGSDVPFGALEPVFQETTIGREARPIFEDGALALETISLGMTIACGLDAGETWCWGGAMGEDAATPTRIKGLVEFDTGLLQACGLTTSGDLSCFGDGVEMDVAVGSPEKEVK